MKEVSEVLSFSQTIHREALMLGLKWRFEFVQIIPYLQLCLECTKVRGLRGY